MHTCAYLGKEREKGYKFITYSMKIIYLYNKIITYLGKFATPIRTLPNTLSPILLKCSSLLL